MKKKLLLAVLSLVCLVCCAFGLTACGLFGRSKHEHEYDTSWAADETYHWYPCIAGGKCDAPEKDKAKHSDPYRNGYCDICGGTVEIPLLPQNAPVEIKYSFTDKQIIVENAYYGDDKTTSFDTEYRLDDGEWKKRDVNTRDYIYYTDLAPASTHTLYARMSESKGYTVGEELSVSVTLRKSVPTSTPTRNDVSYEITGKTVVFTVSDGVELSVDGGDTYVAQSRITYTYPKSGLKDVLIRYAETDTQTASGRITFSIRTTDFASGDGTEENPYLIGTLEQFKALKEFSVRGCYFALTDDIECDNEVWERDLYSFIYDVHIDGRGHTISGLKQKTPIFTSVIEAKNLTVENAVYSAKIEKSSIDNPAIVAGDLNYAENVTVSGTITITEPDTAIQLALSGRFSMAVGGICARLVQSRADEKYGMSRCKADITVSLPNIKEKAGVYMGLNLGGLAGIVVPYNTKAHDDLATVFRCSAKLDVTQAYVSDLDMGGLVGGFANSDDFGPTARISNCYTTGTVNLDFYSKDDHLHSGLLRAGGITPEITGMISECYSAIDFNINTYITKTDDGASYAYVYVGGICTNAHNRHGETDLDDQKLSRCLFAGSITVKNLAEDAGKFYLNAICTDYRGFESTQELYYKSTVVETADGAKAVSGDGAVAVDEDEILTVEWQKQTLKLSDEYYWILQEGQLPVLK